MGDPSFNSDERVLIRTPGIHVKSIPFEGTLTNRRIILTDRAKNILPSKDIPLATIQRVGVGVNALQDPILNISVIPHPGETRQMVLTFSRQEGGNRVRERDEWARLIEDYLYGSSAPQSRAPQAPPAQPRYEVVNTPVPPARVPGQDTQVPPAPGYGAVRTPAPAPARAPTPPPQAAQPSGETVFCTKCGNRVAVDSMFCNRCGTPIVAPADMRKPAPAPQQPPQRPAAPAPVAPPVYAPPAPAARVPEEPVYQAPAPVYTPPPAPSPARQTVPRPAAQPAPQKAAKKGFLSGIFGSSKAQKPAAAPRAPAPEPRQRKSRMPGKKVIVGGIVILVIIAVVAAGAIFVLPNLSSVLPTGGSSSSGGSSLFGGSSGSSSPATLATADADSIKVKETLSVTVPATGVWVRINYMGSYKGTYGMPSDLQTAEDSGDRLFEVVNGTGTIKATVEKKDSSSKRALVVEIYKDGKLLKSGNVTIAFGKVSISADAGGSPVMTGSTSTGSGNVTAKATGNTTQTAAVTTVKTTTPATTTTTKKS